MKARRITTSRWQTLGVCTALLAAGAATYTACVPTVRGTLNAFSSRFADNNRAQVRTVYERLPAGANAGARNALGVPLLVAVSQGEGRRVVAFDLAANRQLWTSDVAAASAPEVLGDVVVVATTNNRVAGLDLRTGRRRWDVDGRSMPFMGAARDGDTIVIVTSVGSTGGGLRAGRVIAVDAQGGGERWSHQVVGILGRPAAAGGFAFVPWDRQSVAVLSLTNGVEQARVRSNDDVISWVASTPQGVYYGSRGAYRWTPNSASGTRTGSAFLSNPLTGVPGDPPLFRDAFAPTTGARTARDKIRFAFRPRAASGETVAVEGDTIYLAYYRFLVAIDVTSGAVRWARAIGPEETPAAAGGETVSAVEAARRAQAQYSQYDIESVSVLPNAVVIVSGNGRVRALDPATGAVIGTQDLNAPIGAIATDLTGYRPPTQGAMPAPEGSAREQIVSLIRDADNRLVPMRAFLVQQLARRPEAEATRDLLELYRQRSIPVALRQEIATGLRARRNGQQFLLAAIEGDASHYNYLENRAAPPLEVIAPTLASMGAREAVPVLMQHLLDHETPFESLSAVISAIATLGDPSVVPQLEAYINRYKSDSAFAGERNVPLQTAAAGIFRLGDQGAREWLTALSQDQRAHAPLRSSVTALFEEERGGQRRGTQQQQLAEARAQLDGKLNQLRAAVGAYPSTLSQDAFMAEWTTHLDDLNACAAQQLVRTPDLNQIRITVRVRSEPERDMFQTIPPAPRLPSRPTFEQQMRAIEQQGQWVDRQLARLEHHQSAVRTLAYSPQSPQLVECMDRVLRPVRFAGFGRATAERTFVQAISTVDPRARRQVGTPGFGTPQGAPGDTLVPWFLVSSPSYDVATGRINPPAAAASVAGTQATGDAGVAPTATTPDAGRPAGTQQGGSTRPWWEE